MFHVSIGLASGKLEQVGRQGGLLSKRMWRHFLIRYMALGDGIGSIAGSGLVEGEKVIDSAYGVAGVFSVF